jgi:hypothetical protein
MDAIFLFLKKAAWGRESRFGHQIFAEKLYVQRSVAVVLLVCRLWWTNSRLIFPPIIIAK